MENTTVALQAAALINSLSEDDQQLIYEFAKRLAVVKEAEYQAQKASYWVDIQRSIDQIAQGKGLVRELVEA